MLKIDVAGLPASESSSPSAFPRRVIYTTSVTALCELGWVVVRYGGATAHDSHMLPSQHHRYG